LTTWDELRSGIHSAFQAEDLGLRALRLVFATSDTRRQDVFISYADEADTLPWAQLDAPIGPLARVDLAEAVSLVENGICGGLCQLEVGGALQVTVRHSVPLAHLDWPDLDRPLRLVALTADAIAGRLGLR
jgi:hypothetical protein